MQVLERSPLRRAIPGPSEQQEFADTRPGTVNLLLFLVGHTGGRARTALGANGAAHYLPARQDCRRRPRRRKGVCLIPDGGPRPRAQATAASVESGEGWWRPRRTPAPASWLNQAELLVKALGGRYGERGSWGTRGEFIDQVLASWPEYNRWYAHPLPWTWTNDRMRQWFAEHG